VLLSGPLPHQEARFDGGVDVRDSISASEKSTSCRVDDSTAILPRDENRLADYGGGGGGGGGGGLWARLSACYSSFEPSGCGRCEDVHVSGGHSSEEQADANATTTVAPPRAMPAIAAADVSSAMQHIFTHGVVHYCLNRPSAPGGASHRCWGLQLPARMEWIPAVGPGTLGGSGRCQYRPTRFAFPPIIIHS